MQKCEPKNCKGGLGEEDGKIKPSAGQNKSIVQTKKTGWDRGHSAWKNVLGIERMGSSN